MTPISTIVHAAHVTSGPRAPRARERGSNPRLYISAAAHREHTTDHRSTTEDYLRCLWWRGMCVHLRAPQIRKSPRAVWCARTGLQEGGACHCHPPISLTVPLPSAHLAHSATAIRPSRSQCHCHPPISLSATVPLPSAHLAQRHSATAIRLLAQHHRLCPDRASPCRALCQRLRAVFDGGQSA